MFFTTKVAYCLEPRLRPYRSSPQISAHTCTIGIPGWEDVMNSKLVDPT
jgi:hypothetical protein